MNDIVIKGARENNLKNINLTLPREKLIVFTGVSGSGKSTLAFDTIFAEGQRKFMESLSSYARMFLGQIQKPEVDSIEGLSPSISIDQKTTNQNPRSTVGTVTEIYDYLRLLFANIGTPYCPNCNKEITRQTVDQIVDKILENKEQTKLIICAPMVRGQKGTHAKLFESLRKNGYVRVEIDGNIYSLDEEIDLDKNIKHTINLVVDRIIIKENIKSRLTESVESALKLSNGLVIVKIGDVEQMFSNNFACPTCGFSYAEITPRMFSFNNPYGACEHCSGIGVKKSIDPKLILGDTSKSLSEGALTLSGWTMDTSAFTKSYFKALSEKYKFSLNTPLNKLPKKIIDILLYGNNGEELEIKYSSGTWVANYNKSFEGVIPNLERRYRQTQSEGVKQEIEKYMIEFPCDACHGKRLKPEILSIKINNKSIADVTDMNVNQLIDFLDNLKLTKNQEHIATNIIKEIKSRLSFLNNVGLNYLTLSRNSGTLSGGESQRIRLATQIGSGLVGVLYILDEPSIGLHQRDNERLLNSLKKLRDLGNTLIVVEHDEETILNADYIVDIGPYAGVHGGEIVAQGSVEDILNCKNSLTGQYLSGTKKIEIPLTRRKGNGEFIEIIGANENNLKNIDVKIPLNTLTLITGVSGSGKSSLINRILYPAVSNKINKTTLLEGKYKQIKGCDKIDKIICIDQSPIGRTPRSNPATYTGVFTYIRELFAETIEAKERNYSSGRFSFNISGGRCEACAGAGIKEIEMYFLPDVYVPCEVCKGKRYNSETLEVKFKGKSIYDVLEMTVEDGLEFFKNHSKIKNKLQMLFDVGLGYIKLGQPATTLSGGEAQRVKLATELSKKSTGRTLYVLDEPTTGLHTYDVHKLIHILQRLVGENNSVVVIEHNLDVIKCADYIVDLGPEGGDMGGTIVAQGTPEQIAKVEQSYTGKFIKDILSKSM